MKRFQFQLEPVLGYKQQILDSLMIELGALQEQARRKEKKRGEAFQRLADYDAEFEEKKRRGVSVVEALEYQGCQAVLERAAKKEEEELQTLRRRVEAKRQQVVEARKDTFSLEKLKDLRRKEYDRAVEKAEERTLDDLTASRRAAAHV